MQIVNVEKIKNFDGTAERIYLQIPYQYVSSSQKKGSKIEVLESTPLGIIRIKVKVLGVLYFLVRPHGPIRHFRRCSGLNGGTESLVKGAGDAGRLSSVYVGRLTPY